jgi:hypothetical protein
MRPGAEPVRVTPVMAGGSPEAGRFEGPGAAAQIEVAAIAVIAGAAVVAFGIVPSPLLDLAADAASSIFG